MAQGGGQAPAPKGAVGELHGSRTPRGADRSARGTPTQTAGFDTRSLAGVVLRVRPQGQLPTRRWGRCQPEMRVVTQGGTLTRATRPSDRADFIVV